MRSLTAHEATTRAASVTVTSYDIELDLTIGPDHFGSKASIVFQSRDRQETFVELAPHAVVSAHLNGERLGPDAWYDGRLRLRSLQDENVLDVAAVMSYSHDGEGLHRAVDPEDGQAYVYAMTFLDAAPRIFPCFDQPDLKAPYQMTVRTPGEWTVVGNGAATQTAPGRWQLTETKPLSTYLVTLVAGPYHSVLREHDGIPLGLHCRQSLAQHLDKDADELFAVTAQCFDEYHGLFGIRYPFGEYHQAFVPEFNAGAMENPGCVTFRDEMVFRAPPTDGQRTQRAITIAHEMAHQWFGDLVTMRWWDDLWLNESFADYMGHRVAHDATGYKDSWLGFALVRKEFGLAADQRRSTHPVAGSRAPDTHTALTNFDGISYAKGAVVLRQLRTLLGDQPFIEGVADYLGRFAYGNATLADLMESWERASGHHLSPWCDAWLRSSGVDTLSVAAGADRQWSVERHNGSGPSVTRTHAVTVASYDRSGSETSVPVVVHRDSVVVPFPAYDGPRLVVPDAGDETWAKVRLSREGQADVAELLPHISEPVTRAVIWGALREALMDAEISPGGYLAVLEHALPHERSDLVLERVLGTRARQGALGYVGTYLPTAEQQARLADLAARILDASASASNRQLVTGRALVALTDDTSLLQSWLNGDAPAGLRVDSDLRWRIIQTLCACNGFDEAGITAELQRDPSSQAAEAAAACRASLPAPDRKAEAWQIMTTDASLVNHHLGAMAGAFFNPRQTAVTAPYVERYFTDFPATASLRRGMVVEQSCKLAYPRYSVTDATVTRSEAVLADESLGAGVRRAISDSTDDLRRVLRTRRAQLERSSPGPRPEPSAPE